MAADLPVLLITWRRPEKTFQVIQALREFAPTRLYIASDGPNLQRQGEDRLVGLTRKLMATEINWPCDVKTLYSPINQGCQAAVVKAISWFFLNEESGVILEDDCVPSQSFFAFCACCLQLYRSEPRVMHVSGNSFSAPTNFFSGQTHSFSRLAQVWGWATWRDRWNFYQATGLLESKRTIAIATYRRLRNLGWHKALLKSSHYIKAVNLKIDAWDYIWHATVASRSGYAVIPSQNLVTNIGVGSDATHTIRTSDRHFLPCASDFSSENIQYLEPSINLDLDLFLAAKMGLSFKTFVRALLVDPSLFMLK